MSINNHAFENTENIETDHLLNSIIRLTNDSIVTTSVTGIITGWNAQAEKMFGYPRAEVMGKSVSVIMPSEKISEMYELINIVKKDKFLRDIETIRMNNEGDRLIVSLNISSVKNTAEEVIGMVYIFKDISKSKTAAVTVKEKHLQLEHTVLELKNEVNNRKEIEKDLRKKNKELLIEIEGRRKAEQNLQDKEQKVKRKSDTIKSLLTHLPLVAWRLDKDANIIQSVGAGLRVLNFKDNELKGKNILDLFPQAAPYIRQVLDGEKGSFIGQAMVDGRTVYKQNFYFHDKNTSGAVGFCIDITEQKEAEERLKKSEALLRAAESVSGTGSWEYDVNTKELIWSDELYRMYGLKRSSGISVDKYIGYIHPEDQKKVKKNIKKILEEKTRLNYTMRIINNHGYTKVINGKMEIIDDINEVPYKIIGIEQDVTAQKKHEIKIREQHEELKNINADLIKEIRDRSRAEKEARAEKEFITSLIENSIDGILTIDAELNISLCNAPMIHNRSLKENRIKGENIFNIIPKIKNTPEEDALYQALKGEPVTLLNCKYPEKDGWYDAFRIPLINHKKEITGVLCIDHDVTDRMKAQVCIQEKNQDLLGAIDSLKKEVVERENAEKEVRLFNTLILEFKKAKDLKSAFEATLRHICTAFGWNMGETWIVNRETEKIECRYRWYDKSNMQLRKFAEECEGFVLETGKGLTGKAWEQKKPVWVNNMSGDTTVLRHKIAAEAGIGCAVAIPLLDKGEVVAVIDFFLLENREKDQHFIELLTAVAAQLGMVIKLKQAEIDVKHAHDGLENKIKDRTHELEIKNKELKDLAFVISHDLKAPLRGIKSLSEFLVEDYKDKLDAEGVQTLVHLQESVHRMDKLIEGILHYYKVGSSSSRKEEIDLNDLVKEVINMIHPPKAIKLDIKKLPVINAQKAPMIQVFQNLIDNAVKFMDKEQGEIKIGCEECPEHWEFFVSDNGSGIEQKDFNKIFKLFQTASDHRKDSTGIGLAIIHKVVNLYGGKIWLESEKGKGATFYFTLPK